MKAGARGQGWEGAPPPLFPSLPSPSLNSHLGQLVGRTARDLGDAQGAKLLLQLLKLGGMSGGKKEGVSKGGAAEGRVNGEIGKAGGGGGGGPEASPRPLHGRPQPPAAQGAADQGYAGTRPGQSTGTRAASNHPGGSAVHRRRRLRVFFPLSIGRAPALSLSLRPAPLSTRTFSVSSSRDLPRSSRALTMV